MAVLDTSDGGGNCRRDIFDPHHVRVFAGTEMEKQKEDVEDDDIEKGSDDFPDYHEVGKRGFKKTGKIALSEVLCDLNDEVSGKTCSDVENQGRNITEYIYQKQFGINCVKEKNDLYNDLNQDNTDSLMGEVNTQTIQRQDSPDGVDREVATHTDLSQNSVDSVLGDADTYTFWGCHHSCYVHIKSIILEILVQITHLCEMIKRIKERTILTRFEGEPALTKVHSALGRRTGRKNWWHTEVPLSYGSQGRTGRKLGMIFYVFLLSSFSGHVVGSHENCREIINDSDDTRLDHGTVSIEISFRNYFLLSLGASVDSVQCAYKHEPFTCNEFKSNGTLYLKNYWIDCSVMNKTSLDANITVQNVHTIVLQFGVQIFTGYQNIHSNSTEPMMQSNNFTTIKLGFTFVNVFLLILWITDEYLSARTEKTAERILVEGQQTGTTRQTYLLVVSRSVSENHYRMYKLQTPRRTFPLLCTCQQYKMNIMFKLSTYDSCIEEQKNYFKRYFGEPDITREEKGRRKKVAGMRFGGFHTRNRHYQDYKGCHQYATIPGCGVKVKPERWYHLMISCFSVLGVIVLLGVLGGVQMDCKRPFRITNSNTELEMPERKKIMKSVYRISCEDGISIPEKRNKRKEPDDEIDSHGSIKKMRQFGLHSTGRCTSDIIFNRSLDNTHVMSIKKATLKFSGEKFERFLCNHIRERKILMLKCAQIWLAEESPLRGLSTECMPLDLEQQDMTVLNKNHKDIIHVASGSASDDQAAIDWFDVPTERTKPTLNKTTNVKQYRLQISSSGIFNCSDLNRSLLSAYSTINSHLEKQCIQHEKPHSPVGKPRKVHFPPPKDETSKILRELTPEIPEPVFDITSMQFLVYFVPEFDPMMSVIDQIASGRPPSPHISMRYEILRFCTLRSYPKEDKPYLIKLAEAGFYYASDGDGVVCYCCGIRRYNWTEADRPMDVHKRINPTCKFLVKNEENNVKNNFNGPFSKALMFIDSIPEPQVRQEPAEDVSSSSAPERIRSPATNQLSHQNSNSNQLAGINTAIPKHMQYATKTARVVSFSSWPQSASHTPDELAEAGFFYAGFGDCVRCFYCGIGLRHWTRDDSPWIEHARWSKTCVFVKQKKGDEFINLVQLAVQYSQGSDETQTGNQPTGQDIENMLLSDAAQSVLDMGYQPRVIKRAIEQILEQNRQANLTAELLMEKLLEIEEEESRSQPTPVARPVAAAATGSSESRPKEVEGDTKKENEQEKNSLEKKSDEKKSDEKKSDEKKVDKKSSVKEDFRKQSDLTSQDPRAIKAENEQLKEQTLCKICLDQTVCIVFLPCGHLVTCADCAPAMRKCPICRALVKGTVRTYMS